MCQYKLAQAGLVEKMITPPDKWQWEKEDKKGLLLKAACIPSVGFGSSSFKVNCNDHSPHTLIHKSESSSKSRSIQISYWVFKVSFVWKQVFQLYNNRYDFIFHNVNIIVDKSPEKPQ